MAPFIRQTIVALAFACIAELAGANDGPPRDKDGWTLLTPSPDSRIVYVSSSQGDDATAECYAPTHPAIGRDPFNPTGAVKPYKTVAAALAQVRDGFPDWVLLRRGDVWYECLRRMNGRSKTEPFVYGAYGPDPDRPMLKIGAQGGLDLGIRGFHDVAVVGLHFYAHTRDPDSPEFVSGAGKSGISCLIPADGEGRGLLIEDCCLQLASLVLQSRQGAPLHDVVIRRNLILDAYSSGGHSQGMFAYGASLILEENVFDHNGWNEHPKAPKGQATMFNHNTYFSHCHDVVFRGNMFLRASSMGNKWRADKTGEARNIVIDDNLYVEGEIGIGIGGNTAEPYRFVNVTITNNVMLDIGRSRPTGRTLAWYLSMQDWDGGTVASNILAHQVSDEVRNTYGIYIGGTMRNVVVRDNIIHNLASTRFVVQLGGGATQESVAFEGNTVQLPGFDTPLVVATEPLAGYKLANNTYYSTHDPAQWFGWGAENLGLDGWIAKSGEQGATQKQADYPDPDRTVETYNAAVGGKPTFQDFIAQVRKQSKMTWRTEYTAHAVNEYIRAGFAQE